MQTKASRIATLRRIAIIGAILTVLVAIDGLFMVLTHYKPDDVNNYNLSDGATVLIAAVLLLIATVVAFILSRESTTKTEEAKQPEAKVEPEVNA